MSEEDLPPSARPWLFRFGVAVLSSGLAVLAVILLKNRLTNPSPLVPYLGAVMFSSWYGGLMPGLLATALNSVAFIYFSLPPTNSLALHGLESAVRLCEFLVVALLICMLNAARSAAHQRAEEALAEARRANSIKDQFLATVSHELRTPLNSILGWAHLLRSGKLTEADRERGLEMIEHNTHAQAQLVEELLDVSRIASGKLQIQTGPLELAPVIEAAVDTVRPTAQAKGIQLHTALDPLSWILGDRDRLQQVIWNLLTNAVKFTPENGHIEVKLERERDQARITVSDTGIGINPEFLPHVFDRFSQADTSPTSANRGLGLGLAIVRHLVEAQGGTVEVESRGLGQGTAFTVRIPLAAGATRQKSTS